jgi:hypothetical protein
MENFLDKYAGLSAFYVVGCLFCGYFIRERIRVRKNIEIAYIKPSAGERWMYC